MKTRATLALALVAGLPAAAQAQEVFVVNYSWAEVNAGTTTPVASPNSIVDQGEGARILVSVQARINGTNAVGQTTNYTSPAPGGVGTVRGLGSVVYDIVGDNNGPSAAGTWGGGIGTFQGPLNNAPFAAGNTPGTVQPGGSSVHGAGGSQFILPGGSASPTNSNVQVFRGVWNPADYSNRIVNFVAKASVLVPTGEQNSVLFAYGLGTDQSTGENFDLLAGKYFDTAFGNGLNIPIAPAPSSLALLGLGALVAGGRRR